MKGNIIANGYNITATKFIGNLQGKADSAANADLATKANQDMIRTDNKYNICKRYYGF